MNLFWALAAALIALSFLFVFVPLWRTRAEASKPPRDRGKDLGLSIYRSQLAELEADRRAGVISEAQFVAARVDLQRSLLEMAGNGAGAVGAPRRSWRWPVAASVAALLPLFAVMIYTEQGGGPLALDPPRQTAQPATGPEVVDPEEEAAMIIAALQERLEASPEDPVGWALLGRVYHAMGRTRAAVDAYASSLEHGGDHDPDILVDYADVLAALRNGNLEGRPSDLLRRALEIDPDHVTGRWLAGTAAFRAGDYPGAREHWQRIARQMSPQSETGAIIRANLAEVDALIAGER
ncbi:c-type cytochrome biogenesis protein CcmI [Thioalkalivibrio sp.]|uniref:c-type cytochrome biogenesis protein CcmI n=1 Tax=Thioalkalivibrio sp. TaxID=2093813 RepID=UPI0012D6A68B|nr:c-type cytochrome biogenesis protein CcmI [Thioalkalivibrio sp.]TVP77020.1 MAG: c-type cytochrome biogenesis protein CcmI [Thioalkalivibrio sp.]